MIKKKKKNKKNKEQQHVSVFSMFDEQEPEPVPKVLWIKDHSYWLNEVNIDDKVMIFDEQNSKWYTGTIIKVHLELTNTKFDITLQVHYDGRSSEYNENINIKFEQTIYEKLRPKYTVKRTVKFIESLFSLYGIDTSKEQKAMTDGMNTLSIVDAIGREEFIESLINNLHQHKESQAHYTHDVTYYFSDFGRLCRNAWHQWRERTQRNYTEAKPIVPEIEVGTIIPSFGFDVAQNSPIFTETKHCNGNIIKYMFTNRQKIQNRMAMICYDNNNNSFIDKLLQKQLINEIKLLQRNNLDFRYPTKDLVIASKQSEPGPWFCDSCFISNVSEDTNCIKCCNERTPYMDGIVDKTYDYGQIMKYNNNEYLKWKIRIQDLLDPLLNSEKFWIPSLFHIDNHSKVTTQSEIHNLPRLRYNKLYTIICKIFECMIPSFEWILGDIKLQNQDIQVIVGMQDYQLYPSQIYYGNLHREGYKEETIEGVGVYYFDKSAVITDDIFNINTETRGVCGSHIATHDKDIIIKNGSFIVFNNHNLNHKLKVLKNNSKIKFATRKILTFFLPEFKVNSVKKNIDNYNDEIIYHNIVTNWIKLCDIQLFEMELIRMIILYSFDIMKQIKARDKLRQTRIKPYRVSQHLAWIGLTN